jgi:hypothetical protein
MNILAVDKLKDNNGKYKINFSSSSSKRISQDSSVSNWYKEKRKKYI